MPADQNIDAYVSKKIIVKRERVCEFVKKAKKERKKRKSLIRNRNIKREGRVGGWRERGEWSNRSRSGIKQYEKWSGTREAAQPFHPYLCKGREGSNEFWVIALKRPFSR